MRKYFLAFTIFFISLSLFAQEKELRTNLGLYGGLNINMHSPNFNWIYVDNQSNIYQGLFNEKSTSYTGNFGLIGNFPLNNTFVLTGRLGFNALGGDFKDTANVYDLNSSLNMLEITPGIQFHNLISGTDIYFLAGLEFGIPLSKSYTLTASNVEIEKNDIPSALTRFGLALGAGWMFEISDDVFLTPELSYRIPFTKVSDDKNFNTWDVPQIRLGINLTFGLGKDDEDSHIQKDAASDINVGFKEVRAYDKNGNVNSASKITVEEVQYAELFPILPYVFFNEKSDVPNEKTQKMQASNEAGSFSIETLESDAEKINSNTLDIVGTRMQKDKNITIKIVGTLDGKGEANNKELAHKRAEFAKSYLVAKYGISSDRISTETSYLPSKPSSTRDPLGVEENRRVEILPTNTNSTLLEPIFIKSDKQRIASPDVIEFIPYADTQDSIAGWELEVMQSGKLIKKYSGSGNPEATQWSIMPNDLGANEIPVDYSFKAWTINDKRSSANGTLPVEYFSITRKKTEERADRTISKFSLMLFDFNSPEVSEQDKKIITDNILPEIKFNSTVQIYGYTDIIGDADYNKKLALQRATNVQNFLKSKMKDAKYEVYGIGESVQIFDNKTTIGRQLSRTVQVYVITPKN